MTRRLLLAILLPLTLAACGLQAPPPSLPAPLASTSIDETAIKTALLAYDGLLSGVDIAVATGIIKPGTPEALQLRKSLKVALDALNLADTARRLGNAPDALSSLEQAKGAFLEIRSILRQKGDRR